MDAWCERIDEIKEHSNDVHNPFSRGNIIKTMWAIKVRQGGQQRHSGWMRVSIAIIFVRHSPVV
jgi:hypothetical protein